MQNEWLTFLLHMKKSIKQIVYNHPVATGACIYKVSMWVATLRQSTTRKMTSTQYGKVNDIDDYDVHDGVGNEGFPDGNYTLKLKVSS